MNPLDNVHANLSTAMPAMPAGRALGEGLFRAATEVSSFFQSAIGQVGASIDGLTRPAAYGARFSPADATHAAPLVRHPRKLLDYGIPHPNVRFADDAKAQWTFFDVTGIGLPNGLATSREENEVAKANRPDPETYLEAAYMEEHLAQFDEGAVSFITPWAFEKFTVDGNNADYHGRAEGLFVLPAKWASEVISSGFSDPAIASAQAGQEKNRLLVQFIEQKMGIPVGCWSNNSNKLLAVFIENPRELNLRFTTGREAGANIEWRPGGYTLGGVPEAMVDKVSLDQGFVIPFYGFAEVKMDRRAALQEAA